MCKRAQEVLLALDPTEVGGGVGRPLPVDKRLVIARAHIRERLVAGEVLTTGLIHGEPTLRVTGRSREVDGDRPDRVHHLAEAREIDLQVVTDRDVEVVLDRLDHPLRSGVERGVDLRVPDPGNRDP